MKVKATPKRKYKLEFDIRFDDREPMVVQRSGTEHTLSRFLDDAEYEMGQFEEIVNSEHEHITKLTLTVTKL